MKLNSKTPKTKNLVGLLAGTLSSVVLVACSPVNTQQMDSDGNLRTAIVKGQPVAGTSPEANSTVALYFPTSLQTPTVDLFRRHKKKPRPPKTPPGAEAPSPITPPIAEPGPQLPATNTVANFCTGTLIAPDIVMTAAHCFADFGQEIGATPEQLKNKITVGFGLNVAKTSNDTSVQFRKIQSFTVHPQYVVDSVSLATYVPMYDVALIRLSEPAPASAQPATLVSDKNILRSGLTVYLVGFGLLSVIPEVQATQMMETDVQVDNPAISATQFTYRTGTSGKGSCSGDSGGPAYIQQPDGTLGVIGITSWGDTNCEQVGAYTSVPYFADWIQKAVQTL
jgi:hypothetical protein